MAARDLFIGIDVGTASVRAALVDASGAVLAESVQSITTWRDPTDGNVVEQSTGNIWHGIGTACRALIQQSGASKDQVKGIGFDATCSLAVCTSEGRPRSVTMGDFCEGDDKRDIIVWMDHRATEEVEAINATGSKVLDYLGGAMSLELDLPKILWLKKHMPADIFASSSFFTLPDYLTYRATGDRARSYCSLYSFAPAAVPGAREWNEDLLHRLDLQDCIQTGLERSTVERLILTAGQPVGRGLSQVAAAELGLLEGTAVASSLIDAYAGWVGNIAAPMEGTLGVDLAASATRLAAIAGTSTVFIAQGVEPAFVKGVWGPWLNTVFPGCASLLVALLRRGSEKGSRRTDWMNVGGQSSTGLLLDHIIDSHPASTALKVEAAKRGVPHYDLVIEDVRRLANNRQSPFLTHLTRHLHIYPDFHGNRAPLADPSMRGMMTGLSLDTSLTDLSLRYLATCEAIALQTRQIVETLNVKGHRVESLFMSGGLVKNALLMQLLADVCGMPVQLPASHSASVVLGAAILGRAAAEDARKGTIETQVQAEERSKAMSDRLWSIMTEMSKPGTSIRPAAGAAERNLIEAKYAIFLESIDVQRRWRYVIDKAMAS